MTLIKCNEFVKRQTKDSGYSHFDGSWEELEKLTTAYFEGSFGDFTKPGYRDGVVSVDLPGALFKSAVIEIDKDTKLNVAFAPRRENEDPFIRVSAKAKKVSARYASIILYRADVLSENNERSSDADWEIVSINTRTSEEIEPLHFYTMARNHLHLPGGTQGSFTAEEFAKSIVYWNERCMCSPSIKWWKRLWSWFMELGK